MKPSGVADMGVSVPLASGRLLESTVAGSGADELAPRA
jgi:hypothetical protein